MNTTCVSCHSAFSIRPEDLALLERMTPSFGELRVPIPPPRRCPQCRERDRMAWRNETHLFARTCDQTGERLISIYPPDVQFPVYRHREWFKDHHDASQLGFRYDSSRTLFEQLSVLESRAPRFHVYNFQEELDVNSQYTNCAGSNKNCYLIFASGYNEQCMYSRYSNNCFNCVDTFFVENSRNCYECTDLLNCDGVFFSHQCKNCNDSWFLYDCNGCHDCICCAGLRQKSYCIGNEQFTKEEYLKRRTMLPLGQKETRAQLEAHLFTLYQSIPHRALRGELNENSTGDYLWSTKNCFSCFDCRNAEDCAYCTYFSAGKDCMDIYSWGEMELCYEISGGGSYGEYRSAFTANSYGCKECYYADHCVFCDHCFACVGLNRKSYCVLNVQYTPEEYNVLVPQIIEQMRRRGEWGEFFPARLSPFGYNHSVANDYYPLEKEEAQKLGFTWSEYVAPVPQSDRVIDATSASLTNGEEALLQSLLRCHVSGRLFRITRAELEYYRLHSLEIPSLHPDEREKLRMKWRTPRLLWSRACTDCQNPLVTSVSPTGPERVVCDSCYQRSVYG